MSADEKIERFKLGIHDMFDHIWDCEISNPIFQDTVGDLMKAVIQLYGEIESDDNQLYRGK